MSVRRTPKTFLVACQRLIGVAALLPLTFIGTAAIAPQIENVRAQDRQSSQTYSEIRISCDIQEANSETGVVTSRGNVRINYPARQIQATATQAQYFSRERRLILSGNVHVVQKGNSMKAETMTYLIDEGRFIAQPKNNSQVESIYIIEETAPNPNNQPQVNTKPFDR